ncbi:MAG TPA: transposase [Candidatus Limnocylindrales bacterium]|nr:transposase [Candidatus Limnocylindrales bacterium]
MVDCALPRSRRTPATAHPTMFRLNQTHHQQDIFGIETQLSPGLRKRLLESKEYAFYKEIFCRIPEALFAELYAEESASRPNAPVNLLVGAMLLQHLNDWTFEELLDRVAFDLKVRAALGLWSLDQESFCRATLFNFQRRLRDYMVASGQDKFQAVFDRLTEDQLERFGLKGTIQRCDSTQIGSNIRDYTRIELLVEVVLRMWRVLGAAHQEEHAERFAPFVEAKTSGQFLYRLRRSDIGATLEQLGELYAWMVEALQGDYGSTEIHRIVCRVFAEHFTRVEERIAVRPAEEIASSSLQSPDDPEATYRNRGDESFRGYVLHLSETADPENALQLVTDVAVAPNNVEDSRILGERLPEMHRKTPDLGELHTDGAYGSEANDRELAQRQILAVQTGIRGPSARAPMRIEHDQAGLLHVRCAAGHLVPGASTRKHYKAEFAAAHCAGCPFAAVCPTQLRLHGGRTFYFTEAEMLKRLRHYRIETLPPERQTLRANVEATIRQFKAPCRDGKLRTRGLCAASRYGFLRAIGINFGRIYRHLRRLSSGPEAPVPVPAPAYRLPALHALLTPLRRLVRALRGGGGDPLPAAIAFA